MTAHLAHAGVWGAIGWSLALFVLGVAVVWAVWSGGGALTDRLRPLARCWLAYGRTRAALMRRPHRPAHRARRAHPLLAAVAQATHLTRTNTPGGTR